MRILIVAAALLASCLFAGEASAFGGKKKCGSKGTCQQVQTCGTYSTCSSAPSCGTSCGSPGLLASQPVRTLLGLQGPSCQGNSCQSTTAYYQTATGQWTQPASQPTQWQQTRQGSPTDTPTGSTTSYTPGQTITIQGKQYYIVTPEQWQQLPKTTK